MFHPQISLSVGQEEVVGIMGLWMSPPYGIMEQRDIDEIRLRQGSTFGSCAQVVQLAIYRGRIAGWGVVVTIACFHYRGSPESHLSNLKNGLCCAWTYKRRENFLKFCLFPESQAQDKVHYF